MDAEHRNKVVVLCAQIIRNEIKHIDNLYERVLAAFRATKNHWLLGQIQPDENERFRAGSAAVYLTCDEDAKEKLKKEMDILGALGAAMDGKTFQLPNEATWDDFEPVGLMKAWVEIKNEESPADKQP